MSSSVSVGSSEHVVVVLRDRNGMVKKVSGRHIPFHFKLLVKLYPQLRIIGETYRVLHDAIELLANNLLPHLFD